MQRVQDPHHRHSARLRGRGTSASISAPSTVRSGKSRGRFRRSMAVQVRINYEKLHIRWFFPLVVYGKHGNSKNIVLALIWKLSRVASKDVFFISLYRQIFGPHKKIFLPTVLIIDRIDVSVSRLKCLLPNI